MNNLDEKYPLVDDAMDKAVQWFRLNRSYCQLEEIQQSRCNVKLINITLNEPLHQIEFAKDLCYSDIYNRVFYKISYKYAAPGERVDSANLRKIRYSLIPMSQISLQLENIIDVFVDGIKLSINDVAIALFDDYFVLALPQKYKYLNSLKILMRPTVLDLISNTNSITIYKSSIPNNITINDFLAYVDGKLTNRVSISEYNDRYVYKTNETIKKTFELSFIRSLVKYGNVSFKNGYLRINKEPKFPISPSMILPFRIKDNGKLQDLNIVAKTSNVFYSNNANNLDYDIFYVYDEREDDDIRYLDRYKYYVDNYDKDLSKISNGINLPEFIEYFDLYNREIGLSAYIKSRKKSLLEYNIVETKYGIDYDPENYIEFLDIIYDKLNLYSLKNRETIKITEEYINNNTRRDNKSEIKLSSNKIDFVSDMLLFKIPNIEKYHINIYINGLRNFYNTWSAQEDGVNYVYIIKNRLPVGTIVEFEFIKLKHTDVRELNILGSGKDELVISNAKLIGLVDGKADSTLNLFDEYNREIMTEYCYYDESKDEATIRLSNITNKNMIYKTMNLNYIQTMKYSTTTRGVNLKLKLSSLNIPKADQKYFRVFKNGREVPRSCYSLLENGTYIRIGGKYTIYELIEIEYCPAIAYEEMYIRDYIPTDNNGEIDLLNNRNISIINRSTNGIMQYILSNGRKLNDNQFKYWCSLGITVHNLVSRRWCIVVNERYVNIDKVLKPLLEAFVTGNHLFDKFMIDQMVGGPITDDESDLTDINLDRTGELYYDLYQEFLKHNIIDINQNAPDYIAIKYGGLVEKDKNNTIIIDANEKQLYWMPLDPTLKSTDNMVEIFGKYYSLLEDIKYMEVIDPNNIPDHIYEAYKVLFDNNVLVLQIPDIVPTEK